VQSQTRPSWDWLSHKDYLLAEAELPLEVENPAVKAVTFHLQPGQILAFRLRANPTVKKDRPGEKQGRRVGIYDEAGQIDWLRRKASAGGFRILQATARQEGRLKDTIHRPEARDENWTCWRCSTMVCWRCSTRPG